MVERKGAFNQNTGNLGRWWTQCPPKPPLKILLSHEGFKGKKGSNLVSTTEMGAQSHSHTPLCTDSWTSRDLPLKVVLFTQFFLEIMEGEAREEISSSVNNLFFFLTSFIYGKNQQGSGWLKDLTGVQGPERRRAWGCLV